MLHCLVAIALELFSSVKYQSAKCVGKYYHYVFPASEGMPMPKTKLIGVTRFDICCSTNTQTPMHIQETGDILTNDAFVYLITINNSVWTILSQFSGGG